QLAHLAGCAAGTANKLRTLLESVLLSREQINELDDPALITRLFGPPKAMPTGEQPDWALIHLDMQQPHATLTEIWRDWQENSGGSWSYGHFSKKYRRWREKCDITMRQIHRGGEKTFVDFAGGTLPIQLIDGTTREAQLFVGVLGASNYSFGRFVWTQSIEDWIECHDRMCAYFGGVTQFKVPDNLKSAVIRAGMKQLVLNATYAAWARHQGTIIFPAKVRKPRYKAKVEVGVQILQRLALWRMRRRTWHSIEEANAELERLLEVLNTRPFKKLPGCRRQRFEQLDQPFLMALPARPFEFFKLIANRLVPADYHVEYEQHFYSVPYAYAHLRVDLRVSAQAIEVLHGGRRICAHERCHARDGLATTLVEHMPDQHRHVHNGEAAALHDWAARVGPATQRLFGYWLTPGSGYHRGLLAARGVRHEADVYDEPRIESACRHAERLQVRQLVRLRSILRFGLDRQPQPAAVASNPGEHEYLRGADYFDNDGSKEVA
ncbi:MAG: IS21 family transposase, partial [Oceanococcaceae bacterium]